jgi:hypothetical protein
MPCILLPNLQAPFPTMIGILTELFMQAIGELLEQHLQAKSTPWSSVGPCIIDIDEGKVFTIE